MEIRALLRSLGQAGRTVIVSTHLLSEIEAACDFVMVIRFGELMFSGPIDELMARTREHIDVRAENPGDTERLLEALAVAGWVVTAGDGVLRVATDAGSAADLNRAAAAVGVTLSGLVVVRDSLEDIFMAMTGRSEGELVTGRGATGEVA